MAAAVGMTNAFFPVSPAPLKPTSGSVQRLFLEEGGAAQRAEREGGGGGGGGYTRCLALPPPLPRFISLRAHSLLLLRD